MEDLLDKKAALKIVYFLKNRFFTCLSYQTYKELKILDNSSR